jgi:Fe-S-cluster-containing dehydrogenase component
MKLVFVGRQMGQETFDPKECAGEEWVMMVDLDRCIACGACEMACQLEHGETIAEPGSFRPILVAGDDGGPTFVLPLACRHCETPCQYHDDYNFWITCPSSRQHWTGKAYCDSCAGRLEQGLWPACATRCTMKTIFFGHPPDIAFALNEKRLREMGDVEIKPFER